MPGPHPNPLAASISAAHKAPDDPMLRHARAWGQVSKMDPNDIPAKVKQLNYVLPVLGALAGNPKVTTKDVIKAAANAAADGRVAPSEAVQFISGMPTKPEALQPWLKNLYEENFMAVVHMKAALLAATQPQAPQAAPQAMPAQGAPPQAEAMPQPNPLQQMGRPA